MSAPVLNPPVFKTEKEAELLAAIRLGLGLEPDLVLWRNAVTRLDAWNPATGGSTMVHGGLPVGSADLVGILTLQVILAGRPMEFGRLFALEVKTKTGRTSKEQDAWLALVRKRGGFATVVRSVDEARQALERARRGESE